MPNRANNQWSLSGGCQDVSGCVDQFKSEQWKQTDHLEASHLRVWASIPAGQALILVLPGNSPWMGIGYDRLGGLQNQATNRWPRAHPNRVAANFCWRQAGDLIVGEHRVLALLGIIWAYDITFALFCTNARNTITMIFLIFGVLSSRRRTKSGCCQL